MKLLTVIFAFVILTSAMQAQQLNFTWGKYQSGSKYTGVGIASIDSTTGTSYDIYFDLSNYYPAHDIFPQADTGGVNLNSSDRMFIGTLYSMFDCWGVKAPTTDSVKWDIKVYPGVYADAARTFSGAKFGSAITLENVLQDGDYLSVKGVYVIDAVKLFPPELIKVTYTPAATKVPAIDDSIALYWRFVYPEVYHQEAIQTDKVD